MTLPETSTPFAGRTGRGIRVAVIDSGVNSAHPHIGPISGGVTIGDQVEEGIYIDLMGHGTAVMAAIQEKAPDAEYFAVRVFYSALRTSIDYLLRAIEWSIEQRVQVINLSLGTPNPVHASRFAPLIARAEESGTILVSARDASGTPALPGSLPGVIGVSLDWDCPRESYHSKQTADGTEWYASGYPRDLPGLARARNLHGISFAVANMAGFVIRACEGLEPPTYANICAALLAESGEAPNAPPERSHTP
jgi:subtilisin family serine protease